MKQTTKRRPLRFTLTTTITTLIIAVSLSILALSYYGSAHSVLVLSENMTAELSKGVIEKLNALLGAAEDSNAVINLMVTQGTLDPTNGERTMNVAAALVSHNEGFSAVDIGLPDGSKYKASREVDGSISRRSDVRTSTNVIQTYYYDNPNTPSRQQNSVKSLKDGYDARTRPWFIKAVTAGKTIWTDMYVSGTSKQFVYSCVTPVYNQNRDLMAVAATDIKLETLSEFLGTLQILDHGRAFVMNDRNDLIAIPIQSKEELNSLFKPSPPGSEEPYQLYAIEELPDRDIRAALLTYRRDGKQFFEVESTDGEPNLVSLVQYSYEGGSTFTIGIIFPRSDIMGNISRNTRFMILGVIVFLSLALLLGSRLSKRISESIAVLCEEVDKVGRLELDSSVVVESRILEVFKISESVTNMKRGLRSFKKYVPSDLVMQLNTLQKEAALEVETRELSIFFSDIADFTSISEQLDSEELIQQLGDYFNGMSRIILDHAGTLDKYIGDGIMAFWGAPLPRENHAILACAAALYCQNYLKHCAIAQDSGSHAAFHTRIGIHTGEVIVGNIGYEERMNYTIIGDAVNLASRLEGLNKFYQTSVIISEDTFKRVQDAFITRKLDRVAVKGRTRGVVIYELMALRGEIDDAQKQFLQVYNQAMELYLNRSWEKAEQAFAAAQKLSPSGIDHPSALLSVRCNEFMRNPPDPNWDGVYTHTSK